MKIAFLILLLIHGLIHLLGFLKAFEISDLKELTLPVSRLSGIFWALASLCFLTAGMLFLLKSNYWWSIALVAVVISEILIILSWKDARFGTIANVLILMVALASFGSWNFKHQFSEEVKRDLSHDHVVQEEILKEEEIQALPEPIRKYLHYTGSIGKAKIRNFKIEFSGELRKNEQSAWMPFESVQYNFLGSSTRRFFLEATMKNLPVGGYHRFVNGQASMDIRLFSIFPVQYQNGKEMGIAETVTFFNDMCCMAPATLVDKRIKWTSTEQNQVKAEFTNNGITIRASLFFNDKGELINFISEDRYAAQENNKMIQLPWATPMKDYKDFNGRKLASNAEAIYTYPEGKLCYGKFHLLNVQYNLKND